MTGSWQQTEPTSRERGFTIFSGSTFALTNPHGEMLVEPEGFFVADQRALSHLRLRVKGCQSLVLRSSVRGDGEVQVLRRITPLDSLHVPALLIATALRVRSGRLEIAMSFYNGNHAAREIEWQLSMAADFADIFAVKEGRVPKEGETVEAQELPDGVDLVGARMVTRITCAGGDMHGSEAGVAERMELPPRSTVARQVGVEALRNGHRAISIPLADSSRSMERPGLATGSEELAQAVEVGFRNLQALRIFDPQSGGDTLAAGAPWFMTLFGRDSLLTSLMVAAFDQELGLGVLQSLALRQGRIVDATSEEEPGRIVHETRMSADVSLFEGGRKRYYGSTDATPLFVVTAAELVRNGLPVEEIRPLLPAVDQCLEWIENYGDLDGDGFVESVRRSPAGLINQGWKDSWNAIVDADGHIVDPPMALVEVQAYVYAAYRARAYLARTLGESDGSAWDRHADELRQAIDERYWLPELGTYALALDSRGEPLATSTSNAGHMLWTGAALPERVQRLTETLMAPAMRTDWGIRTLSSDHPANDPLGYHTGSVWPHDTALIAWGMSRWGMGTAAAELSEGLIRTATHFGGTLPELLGGLEADDQVAQGSPVPFPASCSPQAWAAAAPILALRTVLGLDVDLPNGKVHFNPCVPKEWLPLTLKRIRSGDDHVMIRVAGSGAQTVARAEAEVSVVRTPVFTS